MIPAGNAKSPMPGQVAQGEWRFFIDISWGIFFGFSGGFMGLLWEIYGDLIGVHRLFMEI